MSARSMRGCGIFRTYVSRIFAVDPRDLGSIIVRRSTLVTHVSGDSESLGGLLHTAPDETPIISSHLEN